MRKSKVNMEELKELLPTTDNVTLAQRYGVSRERIRQLRFLVERETSGDVERPEPVTRSEDFLAALGTASDGDVARMFGVTVNVVSYARAQKNIPSFAEKRLQEALPLLKTHSDSFIMEKFGYSAAGVRQIRKQHNAPYDGPKAPRKRRIKPVTETVTETAVVAANPLIETVPALIDAATQEFLQRRHKAGDSTEALAARLEVPETLVRSALGL